MITEFTLGNLRDQVALATGHANLSTKVTKWANRTLMDITTRAFFQNQVAMAYQDWAKITTTYDGIVGSHLAAFTSSITSLDVVNIFRMENVKQTTATGGGISVYLKPVVRRSPQDLFAGYANQLASDSANSVSNYAIVRWSSVSSGGATTEYQYPQIAVYPTPTGAVMTNATDTVAYATSLGCFQMHYLKAVTALSADSDTNWIMQKYPMVILSGVLRYARLYLGDVQGYLIEKAEYENGIRDMVLTEESAIASTPVREGLIPGSLDVFGE